MTEDELARVLTRVNNDGYAAAMFEGEGDFPEGTPQGTAFLSTWKPFM